MAADVTIRVTYIIERKPSLKYPNYTNVLYSRMSVSMPDIPTFTSRAFVVGSSSDLEDVVNSLGVHREARNSILKKGSNLRVGQKATVPLYL